MAFAHQPQEAKKEKGDAALEQITSLPESLPEETAVALGFFDGMHLGHRAVLGAAKGKGLLPTAFTFSTAGRMPGGKTGGRIYPDTLRVRMLGENGAQLVVMPDFSAIAGMGPETFADFLCGPLRARWVLCGEDYRFAAGASANAQDLKRLCAARGCQAEILPPVLVEGERVSSTRIRALLREGRMAEAGRLLGAPYRLEAPVEHGRRLGRTLGFPTINQALPPDAALPRYGVYIAEALAGESWVPALTNIGVRPTVGSGLAPRAETYLEGYSGDLYGETVRVRLLDFLRPERRFSGVDELRAQIAADRQARMDWKGIRP